jgi:hypothetical protein
MYTYGTLFGDDPHKQTAVCYLDREFIYGQMMQTDVDELESNLDANKQFP